MKVRHWSGYGFVNVKKVNKVVGDGGITTLVVDIKGQHEQGLIRDTWDDYLYFEWLVKRFDKTAKYGPWMFYSIRGKYLDEDCYGHDGEALITLRYNADGSRADPEAFYA